MENLIGNFKKSHVVIRGSFCILNGFELCDPPISAQFALDLIFKTLVDGKEQYEYLTTMSESTEQTNSIMLNLIFRKYSRKYRKYCKK